MSAIQADERKFRELILYIATRCLDDPGFGRTKLNKLLFLSDFHAYLELGRPVTGVAYMKLENGPAPRRLVPIREQMKQAGEAAEIERPYSATAKPQQRLVPLRKPVLSMFSAEEIAFVDRLIFEHWGKSGEDLAHITHGYVGWQIARLRETIPYQSVFVVNEPVSDYERQRAGELIAQYGWAV